MDVKLENCKILLLLISHEQKSKLHFCNANQHKKLKCEKEICMGMIFMKRMNDLHKVHRKRGICIEEEVDRNLENGITFFH